MPKVQIGTRQVPVHDFNGRKYFRAGKLLASLMRAGPELWVAAWNAQEESRREATVRLTRAEYSLSITDPEERERFDAITEAEWEASGQVLEVVRTHDPMPRMIMAAFPLAMERQPEKVAELLALAIADEGDLGQAARQGRMDERLTELADDLLDEARGAQLLDLAVIVAEVAHAEINAKLTELGDRVGKLRELFSIPRTTPVPPTPETPQPQPAPTPEPTPAPPAEPVPTATVNGNGSHGSHETPAPAPTREPSSTDSPPPTAGPQTSSSIESPGGSSPSSIPA